MIKLSIEFKRKTMQLPILYKYTSKGQPQQWQIIVEGDSFYTVEGLVDGLLSPSKPKKCIPKNVGKSNETTAEEQAYSEALAKWTKKKEQNYNEVLTHEKVWEEPMTAKNIGDIKTPLFNGPKVYIQPKLDGIRCIASNGGLKSRRGKDFVSCPHLFHSFDGLILDGELYNHEYHDDFNSIVSLVKKTKPTTTDIQLSAEFIFYFVYDIPSCEGNYEFRFNVLKKLFETAQLPPNYYLLPTYEVSSYEEIEQYHEQFLEAGFEGSMIRKADKGYEYNKRSYSLLKKKDFTDEEFEILEVLEGVGNRAESAGSLLCLMKDGKTFKASIKGTWDYSKSLWDDKEKIKGKTATVKYFNLTPDGIPRFPYCIKIDRYSYE